MTHPDIGDIFYNDDLGVHALLTHYDEQAPEWIVCWIFELSAYNWYVPVDFLEPGWQKVA